jgi:hypothetical protein
MLKLLRETLKNVEWYYRKGITDTRITHGEVDADILLALHEAVMQYDEAKYAAKAYQPGDPKFEQFWSGFVRNRSLRWRYKFLHAKDHLESPLMDSRKDDGGDYFDEIELTVHPMCKLYSHSSEVSDEPAANLISEEDRETTFRNLAGLLSDVEDMVFRAFIASAYLYNRYGVSDIGGVYEDVAQVLNLHYEGLDPVAQRNLRLDGKFTAKGVDNCLERIKAKFNFIKQDPGIEHRYPLFYQLMRTGKRGQLEDAEKNDGGDTH